MEICQGVTDQAKRVKKKQYEGGWARELKRLQCSVNYAGRKQKSKSTGVETSSHE